MIRKFKYDVEARNSLKNGIDALANAVKVTLGPRGRNVVIENAFGGPTITKDGVTVAREVNLEDPFENLGVQMVKEVASKTADLAGDGTTTSTVLAQSIVAEGIKNVASGANPMDIKIGIDKAVVAVVKSLKSQAMSVGDDNEKIKSVATVSANNDVEVGEIIASAMAKVGKDGIVTFEQSNSTETEVRHVDGMQFDSGFQSPHFINKPENATCEFENVKILLVERKINAMRDLLPILQKHMGTTNPSPLLIISDGVEGEALSTLVVNSMKGALKIVVVKAPAFGDFRKQLMDDVAVLTGAVIVSEDRGHKFEELSLSVLGLAGKVVVSKDSTMIINGSGSTGQIQAQMDVIKNSLEQAKTDTDRVRLKTRLAKLSGGIAIISVGANTELEMREKMDRVEDAIYATMAAIEEGIVAGGGVALIRSINALDKLIGGNHDENTGISIIKRAIEEPLRQICKNAGIEGSIVVQKVKAGKGDFGYNARTNEYENLITSGVIDPVKVTRIALESAASIAAMVLTTECLMVDKRVVTELAQ